MSELARESSTQRTAAAPSTVDLQVGGMTCASCAARIEKKLNRMPGVSASVNYATGNAHVELPAGTDVDDAIAAVEATGYRAWLPQPAATPTDTGARPGGAEADPEDVEVRSLRQRLAISAALTLPVLALAMVPALQFTYWQWLSLTLAAPVVVWGAWPFHRAAWTNLRHGGGHHGHPDQRRGLGRVRVVAVRAVPRRGGRARASG